MSTAHQMSVVLANEPRAYRETIAVALGMLSPQATVYVVEPDNLDDFVIEHKPQVVLCSELTDAVKTHVPTWAVLYPDGTENAVVQIEGRPVTMPNIELNGIVRLIDETDDHAQV